MKRISLLSLLLLAVLGACRQEEVLATPKPHGYPKISFPDTGYVAFNENYCQFTFQQPKYMRMVQDTSFFGERPANACWFNLDIPAFNGSIHFTYTPLRNASDLFKVYDDAYRLANEHNRKADANSDYVFTNDDNRVYGLLFEIEGQVASPFQFVLTDSSRHALRGALYFNNKPEPDSMRPIIAFVRRDMVHMMNTLRWE